MVGLSAFMMLGCGLWFLVLGASLGNSYGVLTTFVGALIGVVLGVFAGSAAYEVESEFTLRAGTAREAGRHVAFAFWLSASAISWITITVLFCWSLRLLPR